MNANPSTFRLIAKTFQGLEPVLAVELERLGAREITVLNRAVGFEGDKRLIYSANLNLRTALRILKPIHFFNAENDRGLYKGVQDLDWREHLDVRGTLAVDAVVQSDFFNHSQYAALKTKDAIVDQFRDRLGTRPSVDTERPSLRVHLHIAGNECTVCLDSSGDSLHKRGYRLNKIEAPLNEVLAAGLVLLSGWEGKSNFLDPMCGSGTIVIEAASIARSIAPGFNRKDFGFFRWKDFDQALWDAVKKEAIDKTTVPGNAIIGSDISAQAVEIAKKNIGRARLAESITLKKTPFEELEPPDNNGTIIINPPYGERIKEEDIGAFYKMIGDCLKKRFAGYDAWILSANAEALKHVGLRPCRKLTLFNGPLLCKFQKYSLYEGSKKAKYLLAPKEGS